MRILLVEDERKISAFVKKGLQEAGYSVDIAASIETSERLASENPYDLIILDVMLPDGNGYDLARTIRKNGYALPILFLSALGSARERVHGLEAGGDAYLTKPFVFEEVLAQVRALLRRKDQSEQTRIQFEILELDLIRRQLCVGTEKLSLTAKEFSLMEYFMRNPERPISRTELTEHVWDIHFDTNSNIVDSYIKTLRKKIETITQEKYIQTVTGVGYALRKG